MHVDVTVVEDVGSNMKEADRFNTGHMTGQTVEVYDGRKWPVVRCDSVSIKPSDTTYKVIQSVLLTPSVHEKKRRVSKYTLAVGTTHGHIQVFLKDSDLVLQAYLHCPVDEKCLMLIKRPKDASKKLLKTQSLNNLSMSDTQLYRQYDGTALNNPYMTHKVKGKVSSHSVKEHTATDNLNTHPAVRKPGPPTTARYSKKSQAPHPNTFVPIPELGIYTPDQHVLRNGTYAQHCHNREVNNNNSKKNQSGSQHQVDNCNSAGANANGNISSNSSFDESVSSFGFQNKGVLPGFDSGCYGRTYSESYDVYHSCIDLPSSHMNGKIFNTLNLGNHDHGPSRMANNNISKAVQQKKDMVKENSNKMDPGARSHSLGDLTTGLTFSLVGQKKYESVLSVISNSDAETLTGYSSDRNTEASVANKTGPAVRDVHERFHEAGTSSQTRMSAHPPTDNKSELQMVQARGSSKNVSSSKVSDSYHPLPHQPKHHYQSEVPYQQKQQTQQVQQFQQHNQVKQVQKLHSAPETYSQPIQHVASPRVRKDSEDTISSYKSAFSDVRSSQDVDSEHYNSRNIVSTKSVKNNTSGNNIVNPPKMVSSHGIMKSAKDGYSPIETQSTVKIPHPASPPNRQQSPIKPRRSLPSVPLNETSERIKRFTEMMKSRMSVSSNGSRNCSAGSNSSKQTPSRMSSVGSSCSQIGHSRKSSFETASDSEVFIITNSEYSQGVSENSQQNVFPITNGASAQMLSQTMKPQDNHRPDGYYISKPTGTFSSSTGSAGYHNEKDYSARVSNNRRKSYGGELVLQDTDKRMSRYSLTNRNFNDSCHASHEQNACYSQNQRMFVSGETPLPPGDRSADSGQTIGTNHSYNGSALDSGYTTNNDGENDSCKSNPHCYHHQNSQVHPKKQFHSAELKHQNQHNGHNQSKDQTDFVERNFKYKSSNNLANAHRFGSVQNISSAQIHGNPKDFNILKNNQLFNNDKCSSSAFHCKENGSLRLTQEMMATQKTQNGSNQLVAVKNEVPLVSQRLSQLQHHEMYSSANRRSWDYADILLGNKNDGFPDSQIKKYGRADERYRSSEILPSRNYSDGSYTNIHQTGSIENNLPRNFKNQNQSINTSSQHFHSNNANGKLNSIKEFTPLMSHSYHGDLDPGRDITQPRYSDANCENVHKTNNATLSERVQPSGYRSEMVASHWSTEFYKKSNGNHIQQQDEVRPRPVAVSRANRLTRGHTLPGGFCLNESDSVLPPLGQDTSLFHLTQKYDLAPILLNLPQDMLLKNMLELSEFTVEISMVGVPGIPTNPQGKMPQIGTPGSAFTPVKNSLDQNKPLTAKLKLACVSHIWDEIHKYTTLGRCLKGDIIIEVNGWFCLGTDVAYLKEVFENCKDAITLTVARLKESDEKRFKGQTAVERIKGLESEISRLDDLIQARDEKIQSLTSAMGLLSLKQHTGTLSDVNGRIPVEGMVIGGKHT